MKDNKPRHIAIVMDGNGRWAKARCLPRAAGHRAGAKAVRRAVECCLAEEIPFLSLFALSVENRLHRPLSEVNLLMHLFLESLQRNTEELHQNGVNIRVIGAHDDFDAKLKAQIQASEQLTQHNTRLTLLIAINYSGRWDILQATKRCHAAIAKGECSVDVLDEATFQSYLAFEGVPDPDLFIRTSGEQRLSNFMLWQSAYSELFFTDAFWPDFNKTIFTHALDAYQRRERRFGSILKGEEEHA